MSTETVASEPVSGRQTDGGFNISAWCIGHPWVVIAAYAGIVALALRVIFGGGMPRRMMPYVESPMVGIVTMMPGLSAQEVETYLSKPIEERMTDIRGARYIRSTSQEGLSIVSLEFPYGSDMRRATSDVQSLMNAVQADLPVTGANLKPSWVLPIDPLNIPVLSLSVTGDAASGWTPLTVRAFAENEGVRALKQIPEVQSVTVYGGQKRQLRVEADREKLAAFGYSILDVRNAIDQHSTARPAGVLTAGPNETIVRVDDLAQDAAAVGAYPLGARNGRVVYLRDVASVTDAAREQRSGYHFVDGARRTIEGLNDDAVEMAVIQDPAAGSGPVIDAVRRTAAGLERDHPGLHFRVAYDNAHFVDILFHNTAEELTVAIALCGIAIFLFLGSGRGTLISLITIPVSLAMAILLMAPFGFSLNSSTLIGLLVAIGRLVDDSLIDIHAVERHLALGKSPRRATIDGITEVRLAVAASTVMIVLALSPLLVCGGITQIMFSGLVYPILFGLISSFMVSLTLTAVLAAQLLQPHAAGTARRSWLERAILAPVQARLERTDAGYERLVRRLLRHKFTVAAGAVATIIAGFGFYHFIGSEMMPLADVGQAYGVLEMRPGASYAETAAATATLERIMLRHPEVRRVSTETGDEPGGTYFTGYAMGEVNTATLMLTLSDKDARRRDIWQVIDAIQREALATIPNVRRLQIKEMGSDVMASSEAPITLLVTGPDLHILSRLAEQVADVARRTPGALQVSTSWAVEKPSYRLEVDPRLAAQIGLTPADVADQAYYALGGALADEFYRLPNVRQDTIHIRYAEGQRRSIYDLLQMPVAGANGMQAPLKSLATVRPELAPNLIEHDGLRRSISVLAYYRKGGPPSMDLAMAILTRSSAELNFPPGYSLEMRGDMTQMMDSDARLLRGLEIAILLIFLVLIAQFGGLLAPLQMVLSIPLELSGVFIGLWMAHQAFSTVSIMAVIVLTGMDITTAILLIDQIRRRRAEGLLPRDRAIALACRDRLRPILMTSLITIVTMLPVALRPRTGMDAYQPLGTVIVAGLTVGTGLSLLVIPVMHAVVDDLHRGFGRWRRGRGAGGIGAAVLLGLVLLTATAARADGTDAAPNTHTTAPVSQENAAPVLRLTLQDAIDLAQRESPAVREAEADTRAAQAGVGSARAALRPTVSTTTYAAAGNAGNILMSAPGVLPPNLLGASPGPFADQNVTLMVPLYTGRRRESEQERARHQQAAAQGDARAVRLTVAADVTRAYSRVLLAQAERDAARARLTAQDEQVRVTAERVTAGRLAEIDLLREQAEQADDQQAALAAENAIALGLADLKSVMGLGQDATITITDTLEELSAAAAAGLPPSAEEAVRRARAQRPDVGAAGQQVEAARADRNAARGESAPQVYATAMADETLGQQASAGRTGFTLGVSASLPILDGGQRRADRDAADARLDSAAARERKLRLEVERAAASAWFSFDTARKQVAAADLRVRAAEQGYDLEKLRYDLGKALTAERLDALAVLAKAQAAAREARAEVVGAAGELRAAVGGRGGGGGGRRGGWCGLVSPGAGGESADGARRGVKSIAIAKRFDAPG